MPPWQCHSKSGLPVSYASPRTGAQRLRSSPSASPHLLVADEEALPAWSFEDASPGAAQGLCALKPKASPTPKQPLLLRVHSVPSSLGHSVTPRLERKLLR